MNDTPIKQLLLSNAYWVINKNVVKAIGLEPAFLLGIFAEAENKLADEEGWFFQTSAKITELTGLSNHKQTNAINKLIELNVLLQENRGVPCKRYFKISYENIQKLVFKNFENLSLKNSKTSFQKISNNKEYNYKELSIEEIKEINNIHSFAPNKPKQTQKNNTRARELQPIPFKSPVQIDREKRAVVGSAPPYTQEQRAIAEEYFNQFWKEYPKKQGQVEARLAWMRQNYSIETYIAIIKAVERFKQIRRDWQTEGGRYVPMPENFINNERWKDEVKAETVQFDRPMDIALMAGMIMAEEKKNADERGHNIRMDGMARSRADITAGGEHRTVSDDEPFDVPAVWTP